jgi:hypothetical protein
VYNTPDIFQESVMQEPPEKIASLGAPKGAEPAAACHAGISARPMTPLKLNKYSSCSSIRLVTP